MSVRDLMVQSGLMSLNHIVVEASGLLAWHMSQGEHPLHSIFLDAQMDARTRSAKSKSLRVPEFKNGNTAIWNAFSVWNMCAELRGATTKGQARKAVKNFLKSIPV